ncbi:MAG: malate dehydrogenase [Bacilli bacterium]
MRRNKIAVIGAGFTGSTTALFLAQKELGDVVLIDVPQLEGPTKGKALDMQQSGPVLGFDAQITGTASFEAMEGADIVIVTAGIARKPGMSRDDLVNTNASIVREVTKQILHYAPNSIIIILSNPVDAMTYVAYKTSGFPKHRVIGQSGILDTARFRTFVAQALQISVKDILGVVLGGHGDDMVPLVRYSNAGGIPLTQLLEQEKLDQIVERTRKGGGEIVGLLGNGSAYYAPAAAIVEMTEAILKDQRRVLPTVAYLEGEYGYEGLYLGVPTIIGRNGILKIIELELTETEQKALNTSAKSVKNILEIL